MDYSYPDIAKMIDHSLLNPTLAEPALEQGIRLALHYDTASVCIMPYALGWCAELLRGSDVRASTTIGFPHGGHTTATKLAEALQALADGGEELDMVVNISKVLSGDWAYVKEDIRTVVDAAHQSGQKVRSSSKRLFERRAEDPLCEICSEVMPTGQDFDGICARRRHD